MLDQARSFLGAEAASEVIRIDVPDQGGDSQGSRQELEPAVPALQSGSLFGGVQGLLIVDAHRLTAGEAELLASLLADADLDSVSVALVAEGRLPKALAAVVEGRGRTVRVAKAWESTATAWLETEVRRRGIDMEPEAVGALIQRFGADTAALAGVLEQLEGQGRVTARMILERFKNRPNQPVFHYTEAVARGDVAEALRRLGDLLVHHHPLVVLATLETELRRRALALVASDPADLRRLAGAGPKDRWVDRVWRQRGRLRDSGLRRALDALVRADRVLKSMPEETHRVVMERLTVALCRWLTGR
ncbi:MAG: hypothetical protein KatS3mg011_1199 [Acidimicrobiia bacterium]|nr:MAG: hypothetical protein KatS3mg011_1199 [Acidimicrobiia bacterium]